MKKAFTLIELLAVIVILAIIASIATPIVLNIISDARGEADEKSVEMYKNSVRAAFSKAQLNEEVPNTGTYSTSLDGKTLTNGTTIINVEYNGTPVSCAQVSFYNRELTLNQCTVIESGATQVVYSNSDVVYFKVTGENAGKSCTETEYNANSEKLGNEGCLKFYAFLDSAASSTVNLLLDHNTTNSVAWNSNMGWAADNDTTDDGPVVLLEQLHTDTDGWLGTEPPQNYNYTNTTGTVRNSSLYSVGTGYSYNIDYSEYKARLISADEIAQITGNVGWNSATGNWFYLDTNNQTASMTHNYEWLYENLNNSSAPAGYWTSSAYSANSDGVWFVSYFSDVNRRDVNYSGYTGLRPVITVSKSKIS